MRKNSGVRFYASQRSAARKELVMAAFVESTLDYAVREDIPAAHRKAWTHIAAPGSWLTGRQRIAVAEETRRARTCSLCAERKAALSPFSISGRHNDAGPASSENTPEISAELVDAIHRVVTDAGRLTKSWYEGMIAAGVSPEEYVEALGVAVITISIDEFHHAMGFGLEPLPSPVDGAPTGYRPTGAEIEEDSAWVPILGSGRIAAAEKDLFDGLPPGAPPPNVIRALSLVPDEVRAWKAVSSAQYLSTPEMKSFESTRAIDRAQIELVAGRVSAINECFY